MTPVDDNEKTRILVDPAAPRSGDEDLPDESHPTGPGTGATGGSGTGGTFRGWSIVRNFPAQGGEADISLIEKAGEQRILKLYRYGITPKKEVFEAVASLGVKHPAGFVRLFEFGLDPGTNCFFEIDEFVSGGTLADHLVSGRLSEDEIEALCRQLVPSLEALHEHGILHLDLKPGNLLVRNRDPLEVVLSDFGLSSIYDAALSQKFTQTKGTSLYQSPESVTGAVNPKSDWWSFGIMVMELLMGRNPFDGLQAQVILYQLTTQGVEIPQTVSGRWRNLLMGLLTRNPEKRWGGEQVRAWLGGATVETGYQEEMSQAREKPSASTFSASSQYRRLGVPFTFRGVAFNALEDLAGAMIASRDAWEDGKADVARGKLAEWLEQNGDSDRARQVRGLMDESPDPDQLLFRFAIYFRADLPFVWRGVPLDDEQFRGLLKSYSRDLDPGDKFLVEGVFSGELFQEYVKLTGGTLGKVDPFLRIAKGMKGTDLEKEPVSARVEILRRAIDGDFAGSRALSTLKVALGGAGHAAEEIFLMIQKKGFNTFAQKAALWQPGDQDLWNMVMKVFLKSDHLRNLNFATFFQHSESVLAAARKDPTIRDFIVRVFGRANIDLGLVKQIQDFSEIQPWVEPLIRSVYNLPSGEKLKICLGNLMVAAPLNARWDEISGRYIIPPFLNDLRNGKVISQGNLKLARQVIDQPDLLPLKSPDFSNWAEFVSLIQTPAEINPESIEYLDFLRRERDRLSMGQRRTCFESIVRWVIYLLAGFFLLSLTSPPRRYSGDARERSCYANMRTILGAVEMYNMDHSQMMSGVEDPDTLNTLLRSNYLRNQITRPVPGCRYSNDGDLTGLGAVTCEIHGTVDDRSTNR